MLNRGSLRLVLGRVYINLYIYICIYVITHVQPCQITLLVVWQKAVLFIAIAVIVLEMSLPDNVNLPVAQVGEMMIVVNEDSFSQGTV